MKVTYNSSLWSKEKGPRGLRQRTNWYFDFAGLKRCIPAVYRFPRGFVFDLITFLDEGKVREFIDKYENSERKLTPLQRRSAHQEHPYQSLPIKEIWMNDIRVDGGYSSSSSVYIPWVRQDDNLISLHKAYSSVLKRTVCFACERYCVPYPETNSKSQKLIRYLRLNRVNDLKLVTYPVQRFYPLDIQFDMSPNETLKEIHFDHPITKDAYTLYFQGSEIVDMPFRPDAEHKLYVMQSAYEVDPVLPKGDTLQFNSSMQYNEPAEGKYEPENEKYKRIKEKYKLTEEKYKPAAASSIGIIGGSSGPTAVFVTKNGRENAAPVGIHGLPLSICFSVPTLKKEETSHFALDGINVTFCDSKEIIL